MKKIFLFPILFLGTLFLAACSKDNVKYEYPPDPNIARQQRGGKFFNNNDVTLLGKTNSSKSQPEKQKNSLWISSIQVIGDLLPISTLDENSGIIVTEWYTDSQNQDSRIKINVLVKGAKVKDENLSVSIFRQKKDWKGNWQDDNSGRDLSAKLIKDKIIERAKMIP